MTPPHTTGVPRHLSLSLPLESILRFNPHFTPSDKVLFVAKGRGLARTMGELAPLVGLKNRSSLHKALSSADQTGQEIRERLAEVLGLEVSVFWQPLKAA